MTTDLITRLRGLAEVATQGLWWITSENRNIVSREDGRICGAPSHMQKWNWDANAAYIVATRPQQLLLLLDALQSQAERINALEREIERLTGSLRYEVDCVAAIGAERDDLRVQLDALQVDDELPEPVNAELDDLQERLHEYRTRAHQAEQAYLAQAAPAAGVPDALPMDTAPTNGTMVRLLVDFEDNSLEDTDQPVWTVGACYASDSNGDVWQFAGWNWSHECFTEGHGKPIGWLPMLASAQPQQKGGV